MCPVDTKEEAILLISLADSSSNSSNNSNNSMTDNNSKTVTTSKTAKNKQSVNVVPKLEPISPTVSSTSTSILQQSTSTNNTSSSNNVSPIQPQQQNVIYNNYNNNKFNTVTAIPTQSQTFNIIPNPITGKLPNHSIIKPIAINNNNNTTAQTSVFATTQQPQHQYLLPSHQYNTHHNVVPNYQLTPQQSIYQSYNILSSSAQHQQPQSTTAHTAYSAIPVQFRQNMISLSPNTTHRHLVSSSPNTNNRIFNVNNNAMQAALQQQQQINNNHYYAHQHQSAEPQDDTQSEAGSDDSDVRRKKRLARKAELARMSRLRKKSRINELEVEANKLRKLCADQKLIIEQYNINNKDNKCIVHNKNDDDKVSSDVNDLLHKLHDTFQPSAAIKLCQFIRLDKVDCNALSVLAQSMRNVGMSSIQTQQLHVAVQTHIPPNNDYINNVNRLINNINDEIIKYKQYHELCYNTLKSVLNEQQLNTLIEIVEEQTQKDKQHNDSGDTKHTVEQLTAQ